MARRPALVVLAATLALAACGDRLPDRPPATGGAEPRTRSYVGVWAAQLGMCGETVWRISPTALYADSGTACLLSNLRPSARAWSATAACAEADPGVLTLGVTEGDPDSLVLAGAPFAVPVTLFRCPGPGEPPVRRDPHGLLAAAYDIDLELARRGPDVTTVRDPNNLAVRAVSRIDGQIAKIVEPVTGPTGDPASRAYYFSPGRTEPFLVRGPDGAYGFAAGRLTAHFDEIGRRIPEPFDADRARRARSLLRQAATAFALAQSIDPGVSAAEPAPVADAPYPPPSGR